MPVLKNIAAIAKGMSITFMEMFQPTIVENYPDGKGPLRGARVRSSVPRGACSAAGRERAGEVCGMFSVRGGVSVELHLH